MGHPDQRGDEHAQVGSTHRRLTGAALTRPEEAPRETVLALARAACARASRVPSSGAGGPAADLTALCELVARTRRTSDPATRAVLLREAAAAPLAVRGSGDGSRDDDAADGAERLL